MEKAQDEAKAGKPGWFPRAWWLPGSPLMPGEPPPSLGRRRAEFSSLYMNIHGHATQFSG